MAIALGRLLQDRIPDNHNDPKLIDDSKEAITTAHGVRNASDFAEMCSVFGYGCEEHVVITPDAYLLVLHRVLPRNLVKDEASDSTLNPKQVVFLQHGLLTNSEFFVALSDAHRCLPLILVDSGFDVWLGNNRYGLTLA